jgi:hypothetical protein
MARFLPRALLFVAAIGFGVAAVWLLWADRGTILGDQILHNTAEAARWLERATAIDLIDRNDIPAETDQIGHAILWMVGTVLIGSLRMMRRPLAIVGIELAALSLFSEFAQPLVSMNRGFEPGDAMANLVGVGFGVTALAGVVLLGNVTRLAGIRR